MFPEEYFDVRFSTKNGTYHHVYTKKPGKTVIEGVLTSIIQEVLHVLELSLSLSLIIMNYNETALKHVRNMYAIFLTELSYLNRKKEIFCSNECKTIYGIRNLHTWAFVALWHI